MVADPIVKAIEEAASLDDRLICRHNLYNSNSHKQQRHHHHLVGFLITLSVKFGITTIRQVRYESKIVLSHNHNRSFDCFTILSCRYVIVVVVDDAFALVTL